LSSPAVAPTDGLRALGLGQLTVATPPSNRFSRIRASVLIPSYNRGPRLLQTLASLERQSVDPSRYEVIIGVDGSTDGTVEALAQLRPGYPLRWAVLRENRGIAAALNAAARLARHDVLIILADDMLAAPEFISAHLEAHQGGTVFVQGNFPLAPGYDRTGAALQYERNRTAMTRIAAGGAATWHIWSGNCSLRRRTWLEVGGSDESFHGYGAEDTDLGLRIAGHGVRFVFEPRALTYHRHAVSQRRYGSQVFSEGQAVVRLARKHRLPLEEFPGSVIRGPIDHSLQWGWRRGPRAMDAVGWLLTVGLWGADLVGVRRAQLAAARLVRRFYRVGGISRERLATPTAR